MLKETFQIYLNRLTDLSSRNRSLYLSKLHASQMIDLKSFDFLNHHPAFNYIKMLIEGKKSFPLIPISDPRDQHVNKASRDLNRILHQVQLTEEETGEKSLYLAYPFVEGKLLNGQVVRCPLIFFPIKLTKEQESWIIQRNQDDQAVFNKTFLLSYERAYGKTPISEDDLILEDYPDEAMAFRTALYEVLKDNFSINFNQKLYEDKLEPFPESAKSLDEAKLKTGELKLMPYAVLGQFSQKTSFLMEDYSELIKESAYTDLEELFTAYFAPEDDIQIPREDQLYHVFPLDASQEEVVKAVRAGNSCVVEGPPGTGKSQLISNLVVDFIARGKKVLVVSQKRAALDVVYKRLNEKAFGSFLALVHDFRADRKSLFEKIKAQIDSIEQYQDLNRSINAIQLEREFSQLSRTIEMHLEYLDELKKSLFNTEECGIPIKQLYMTSRMGEESLDLTQYYKKFHWDRIGEFLRNLKSYEVYYRKYQHAQSFWLHRVDFSGFGAAAAQRIKETLTEIDDLKSRFDEIFGETTELDSTYLFSLYDQREKLQALKHFLHRVDSQKAFDQIKDVPIEEFDLLWIENKVETVKGLLSQEGVVWSLPDGEIQEYLSLALDYIQSKTTVLGKINLFFNKNKFSSLKKLLESEGLTTSLHDLNLLISRLENRLNLNHQYTLLDSKSWLEMPAKPFNFVVFNHYTSSLLEAIQARFVLKDLDGIDDTIHEQSPSAQALLTLLAQLESFTQEIELKLKIWSVYLSKIQIQHLVSHASGESFLEQKEQIPFVFDDLLAFDTLRAKLSTEDKSVMEKLLNDFPEEDFDQLSYHFLVALSNAWIDHIESKYPVLREVATPKFQDVQQELVQAIEEKWKISQYISELRIREQTFRNLEFNRLNNLVTYRELLHQVSKKRRLWSIKKLIATFENELFKLIPCWLASPETVSALFPMKQEFDLVIFDEASQCYVEKGIPAMLRAKQVVIAGDSQQLQPYDLYQAKMETEEEGIDLETESLLELASGYFKKFWLKGHYRSAQRSLIDFSNQHFYKNKLEMLVDRELLNQEINPFHLVKLDGIWEKQQNTVEAEEVLNQIKEIQQSNSDWSIGVITFNYFQMELIIELIEHEENIKQEMVAVKNIENVQGDEFDWVIFSIGYAKNKAGKLIANFGMLSKKGGANRLNVAITRARKRVTLVTSLSSRDFKKGQVENQGIKMLRDYLAFVEGQVEGLIEREELPSSMGFVDSWSLKKRLKSINEEQTLHLFTETSWMDLAVRSKEEGYLEAVLTDDQRLYDSSGAKEAFVYHPLQLKAKNWPFHFYFSRQYWMGKELFEK
ncbi:Superfamily I DNA and/or RNA helicase [Belliella buryatensis]|uniref:Superfamily I DNA and/or RNA helicase n=1 Tax=Belliella buryatensis TaxID=1500549 RepID=A0A239AQM2_9BACT|nr:AAA domain-containing protein [Belliella buryatensis]SNR97354.1 Superfamily I DNA and/or RNA helicase [Belliella buryatensis]